MSSRKNIIEPHQLMIDGAMENTDIIYSDETDIRHQDNVGLQIRWTGDPTGTITIQATINGTDYEDLTLTGLVQPAGTDGSIIGYLNQLPYRKVRVKYENASGTGVLNIWIMSKMI